MRSPGTARSCRLAAGLVAALVLVPAAAWAGRFFHDDAMRIASFEVPEGWQRTAQSGYPRILLIAEHPTGVRLVLGAQHVTPGTTALSLARDALGVLRKQGFRDGRLSPGGGDGKDGDGKDRDGDDGAGNGKGSRGGGHGRKRARLDATFAQGRQAIRQYYVVDVDLAVVVTVTAPVAAAGRFKEADEAVRSLKLAPLPLPAAAANAASNPDGGQPAR